MQKEKTPLFTKSDIIYILQFLLKGFVLFIILFIFLIVRIERRHLLFNNQETLNDIIKHPLPYVGLIILSMILVGIFDFFKGTFKSR